MINNLLEKNHSVVCTTLGRRIHVRQTRLGNSILVIKQERAGSRKIQHDQNQYSSSEIYTTGLKCTYSYVATEEKIRF